VLINLLLLTISNSKNDKFSYEYVVQKHSEREYNMVLQAGPPTGFGGPGPQLIFEAFFQISFENSTERFKSPFESSKPQIYR
jgi:hypothetical protein